MIPYIDRKTGEKKYENPPGYGYLRLLYNTQMGKRGLLPLAKKKWMSKWYGKKMDRPKSTEKILPFVEQLGINLSEAKKSLGEFTSFNDFFYRELKPGARPLESGLLSPGDGKILVFKNIAELQNFFIKGQEFTLETFLQDKNLAQKYSTYSLAILRLAPNDYHRYHFPYAGVPGASKEIKGHLLSVSPIALAKNFVKVFLENKREICILETQKDDIVLLPVGATMVGSIHSTYTAGKPVEKGAEMGYFSFGGSTIMLLFSPKYFTLCEDLIKNTQNKMETFVQMGETIAKESD